MMKRNLLAGLALGVAAVLGSPAAAQVGVTIGGSNGFVSLGTPSYSYYSPPAYYAPRVYAPPVYGAPIYYGGGYRSYGGGYYNNSFGNYGNGIGYNTYRPGISVNIGNGGYGGYGYRGNRGRW